MHIKTKALILAAGKGTRLYPLTLEKPKCLLEIGGKSLINRQIEAIRGAGINDITVVVGYKKEMIINVVGDRVKYREYSDFDRTNNLHTLWSVRDELNSEFICLFSDLIFDTEVISRAIRSSSDICMVCNTREVLEGTMRIILDEGRIVSVGSHIPVSGGSGNFLGIAKFSRYGSRILFDQMKEMVSSHEEDYYTMAIDALAKKGVKVDCLEVNDLLWKEIDTNDDLVSAMRLHEEGLFS